MQPNLGSAVVLYGRQDVLARLDEYFMQLDAPDAPPGSRCGYVFLLGSAGTGTSVIARKWAQRAAQLAATHVLLIPLARKTPPEKLRNCLRQQLLSLFERTPTPDLFTDSLDELLSQVSARLSETGQRLFLVLNSLDEVEDPQLSMPLPQLSPHIFALCAAEPTPPVTLLQSLQRRTARPDAGPGHGRVPSVRAPRLQRAHRGLAEVSDPPDQGRRRSAAAVPDAGQGGWEHAVHGVRAHLPGGTSAQGLD